MQCSDTTRQWLLVSIDSLPKSTKHDIISLIYENHEIGNEGFDEQDILANLLNLVEAPMVWLGTMDVKSLHETMDRNYSERAVHRYKEMLDVDSMFDFDPIFIKNGKFLDGAHRMEAYHLAKRDVIPVVEIGHFMNASVDFWTQWLAGDDVKFDPGPKP